MLIEVMLIRSLKLGVGCASAGVAPDQVLAIDAEKSAALPEKPKLDVALSASVSTRLGNLTPLELSVPPVRVGTNVKLPCVVGVLAPEVSDVFHVPTPVKP